MNLDLPIDTRNVLLLQMMMTMFISPERLFSAHRKILKKLESLRAGLVIKKNKRSDGAQTKYCEIDMSKFE